MSVTVGNRKQDDSMGAKQARAVNKALELAIYTVQITSNKKSFDVEYQDSLINSINQCAIDIYTNASKADHVYVSEDNGRWPRRKEYQLNAVDECENLFALINIAKRVCHVKGTRVYYWIGLVNDTENLIKAWAKANHEKYGKSKKVQPVKPVQEQTAEPTQEQNGELKKEQSDKHEQKQDNELKTG